MGRTLHVGKTFFASVHSFLYLFFAHSICLQFDEQVYLMVLPFVSTTKTIVLHFLGDMSVLLGWGLGQLVNGICDGEGSKTLVGLNIDHKTRSFLLSAVTGSFLLSQCTVSHRSCWRASFLVIQCCSFRRHFYYPPSFSPSTYCFKYSSINFTAPCWVCASPCIFIYYNVPIYVY